MSSSTPGTNRGSRIPRKFSWKQVHGLVFSTGVGGLLLWSASPAPVRPKQPYLHAPSVDTYARHDPDGLTILPTGRYLKPAGTHRPLSRWPHGLVMSPDGNTLFIPS